MSDPDSDDDNEGQAGTWPTVAAKAVKRQVEPEWEETSQTKPVDPHNPNVEPELPADNEDWEYWWRKLLQPPAKQHKPGLPNIGLGPFDAPLKEWRLFRRPKI